MRIAYLVPRATPDNSHGRYVIELAARLAGAHDVEVFAGAVGPLPAAIAGCHRLPVPNRPALARLATLWVAATAVRAGRSFDVIHTQGADAPGANVVT